MSDPAVVVAALLVGVAAIVAPAVPVTLLVVAVALASIIRRPVAFVAVVVLIVAGRAHAASSALDAPLPERVEGTAQLVSDPVPGPFGTSVELRVEGRRWQARVGRSDEWTVRRLMTGDHVVVSGRPTPLRSAPEGWRRSRHLAARLNVKRIGPGPRAPPWYRAANEVHRLLDGGTAAFRPSTRALYLGLVLGDDRDQTDVDRFRFRATGLGHLLAVSGQNVAFLLAVTRPLMVRCSLRTRWVVGLSVLAGFVLVTRAEASVLRAAAMAAVALVASTSGRVASGARVLSIAVVVLLVVDPLLAQGLGFRLSVCATIGLLVGVRPIAVRLPGPRWLAEALACTIAAQVATAPLLVGLNGGIPAVATLTNVAAVPAAGLVMMLGLSVGLVAGTLVDPVAAVLNAPSVLLVRWIELVAEVGSRAPLPLLGPGRLALLAGSGLIAVLRVPGRRSSAVAAVLLALVACLPVSPPVGRTVLHRGVEVLVDHCGTRTVRLSGRVDVMGTLTALQSVGVVSADAVVGPPGTASLAVAGQLRAAVGPPAAGSGGCTVTP